MVTVGDALCEKVRDSYHLMKSFGVRAIIIGVSFSFSVIVLSWFDIEWMNTIQKIER